MELGADGSLYVLEWGGQTIPFGNPLAAKVVRYQLHPALRDVRPDDPGRRVGRAGRRRRRQRDRRAARADGGLPDPVGHAGQGLAADLHQPRRGPAQRRVGRASTRTASGCSPRRTRRRARRSSRAPRSSRPGRTTSCAPCTRAWPARWRSSERARPLPPAAHRRRGRARGRRRARAAAAAAAAARPHAAETGGFSTRAADDAGADQAQAARSRSRQADVPLLRGERTLMWTFGGTFPGPTIRRPAGLDHARHVPPPHPGGGDADDPQPRPPLGGDPRRPADEPADRPRRAAHVRLQARRGGRAAARRDALVPRPLARAHQPQQLDGPGRPVHHRRPEREGELRLPRGGRELLLVLTTRTLDDNNQLVDPFSAASDPGADAVGSGSLMLVNGVRAAVHARRADDLPAADPQRGELQPVQPRLRRRARDRADRQRERPVPGAGRARAHPDGPGRALRRGRRLLAGSPASASCSAARRRSRPRRSARWSRPPRRPEEELMEFRVRAEAQALQGAARAARRSCASCRRGRGELSTDARPHVRLRPGRRRRPARRLDDQRRARTTPSASSRGPELGSTETWLLVNMSQQSHYIHLHAVDWKVDLAQRRHAGGRRGRAQGDLPPRPGRDAGGRREVHRPPRPLPHPLPHAQPRGPRDDDHVRDRRPRAAATATPARSPTAARRGRPRPSASACRSTRSRRPRRARTRALLAAQARGARAGRRARRPSRWPSPGLPRAVSPSLIRRRRAACARRP